jgi:hypothetical protein
VSRGARHRGKRPDRAGLLPGNVRLPEPPRRCQPLLQTHEWASGRPGANIVQPGHRVTLAQQQGTRVPRDEPGRARSRQRCPFRREPLRPKKERPRPLHANASNLDLKVPGVTGSPCDITHAATGNNPFEHPVRHKGRRNRADAPDRRGLAQTLASLSVTRGRASRALFVTRYRLLVGFRRGRVGDLSASGGQRGELNLRTSEPLAMVLGIDLQHDCGICSLNETVPTHPSVGSSHCGRSRHSAERATARHNRGIL